MTQLGGHAIYLAPADIRLGERETVPDVAHNLERWVDGIVARTFRHDNGGGAGACLPHPGAQRAERTCTIPSRSSATCSPLWEKRGRVRGLHVVFVGDGNNVCHSWLEAAAKLGLHFTLACPKGYEPDAGILAATQAEAVRLGVRLAVSHDPVARRAGGRRAVYRRLDQHGPGSGERQAPARLPGLSGGRATPGGGGPGGTGHALPAGSPRRGDQRRGHGRAAEYRLRTRRRIGCTCRRPSWSG